MSAGAILRDRLERALDFLLRVRIERGRGFVQQQDWRVLEDRRGARATCCFSPPRLQPAFPHQRSVAIRQAAHGDEICASCAARSMSSSFAPTRP